MSGLLFICGFGCAVLEAQASLEGLTVSRLNGRMVSSYECQTDVDIRIQFLSDAKNRTLTIAQCKTEINTCYLLDQAFGEYYGVSFTGHSAILNVLLDTETTRGTYMFCETQNVSSCVSVEIGYTCLETSTTHTIPSTNQVVTETTSAKATGESKTDRYDNAVLGLCSIILVLLFVETVISVASVITVYRWLGRRGICNEVFENVSTCKPKVAVDELIPMIDLNDEESVYNRPTVSDCKPKTTTSVKDNDEERASSVPKMTFEKATVALSDTVEETASTICSSDHGLSRTASLVEMEHIKPLSAVKNTEEDWIPLHLDGTDVKIWIRGIDQTGKVGSLEGSEFRHRHKFGTVHQCNHCQRFIKT